MTTPLLIDADSGSDDAVALALVTTHAAVDLRAVVAAGCAASPDDAVADLLRLLSLVPPPRPVLIGRGREPARSPAGSGQARGIKAPATTAPAKSPHHVQDLLEVYRQAVEGSNRELTVLTTGPLTNLAALLREAPDLAGGLRQVVVTGGSVWAKGGVGEPAETTFVRDPEAANFVLRSGLPLTVVPRDVTNYVLLDESHVARLAAAQRGPGPVLARLLRPALESDSAPGYGKVHLPAAVAAAGLLWPKLFVRTRMRLEVSPTGRDAGRCRPALGGDPALQVNLLTAVSAVDLVENMLECLCGESFVV